MLGEYRWRTYTEMNVEAGNFGRGLMEMGLRPKDNIALFSETRAEWLIGANGCMKQSMPVVTLYANLGEDALVHAINETEVTCVITSQELLPKFENILPRTPSVSILVRIYSFALCAIRLWLLYLPHSLLYQLLDCDWEFPAATRQSKVYRSLQDSRGEILRGRSYRREIQQDQFPTHSRRCGHHYVHFRFHW